MTSQKAVTVGNNGVDGSEVFRSKLKFQVQHEVFRVKVREGRIGEITEILVISWLPDPPLGAREELGYPLSEVVLG